MKKGEHNGRKTQRGFQDYAAIIDTYGNILTVRESSWASGRAVWLFTTDENGVEVKVGLPWRPLKSGEHFQYANAVSPHLDVAAAKRLVAALQRFIDEETITNTPK